jgi:hypothetical protein
MAPCKTKIKSSASAMDQGSRIKPSSDPDPLLPPSNASLPFFPPASKDLLLTWNHHPPYPTPFGPSPI